ncbi:MBL fold metallo-hydrolase [Dactylosporangium cerinum]
MLTKTAAAAGTPADAGTVDVVLLSHDQHPDNLDHSGRAFAASVPLILSTPVAAARLGDPTVGLEPWAGVDLPRPDGAGHVRVTAVPAQHGPDGTEHLTGPVTGFVLHGDGVPTVYVSGDNASLRVVAEIAERFPAVDVAILFGGRARTALLGDADLTARRGRHPRSGPTAAGADGRARPRRQLGALHRRPRGRPRRLRGRG